MNRRLFLFSQPILYKNDKPVAKVIPASTRQVNSNDTIFTSQNGKLVITSVYDDYGSCVAVTNETKWDDPITNTMIKKLNRDLYILETDNM